MPDAPDHLRFYGQLLITAGGELLGGICQRVQTWVAYPSVGVGVDCATSSEAIDAVLKATRRAEPGPSAEPPTVEINAASPAHDNPTDDHNAARSIDDKPRRLANGQFAKRQLHPDGLAIEPIALDTARAVLIERMAEISAKPKPKSKPKPAARAGGKKRKAKST
jgi:hypothetical protein